MAVALHDLINPDEDRVMIIDLGPNDGRVMERIEFIGIHREHLVRKFIIE